MVGSRIVTASSFATIVQVQVCGAVLPHATCGIDDSRAVDGTLGGSALVLVVSGSATRSEAADFCCFRQVKLEIRTISLTPFFLRE